MLKTSSRGFTLVELLIVVIVIAILATFSYPVYIGVQERARVTQDMSNLQQIGLGTQRYLTDNDNVLFLTGSSWMSQLHPSPPANQYLPAWSIFQSAFDKRTPSETGDANTPVSYGINGKLPTVVGTVIDKISNPSVFILFAPAQDSFTAVRFQGTVVTGGNNKRGYGMHRKNATPAERPRAEHTPGGVESLRCARICTPKICFGALS